MAYTVKRRADGSFGLVSDTQPVQSAPVNKQAEIERIYQAKLPGAIRKEEQSVDWLGKLITDRDWKKRAETNARTQASNEYQAKYADYSAPELQTWNKTNMANAQQASKNAQNAINNTKTAVNIARFIPGAAIGEWGANMIRQNMDTPFSKRMTLDDLISEQQNIPLAQVRSMSMEEKNKLGAMSQGMMGVGAALDIIPGLSAVNQIAKTGVKKLPQIVAKDLIKETLTKQGLKKLAVAGGTGGLVSSGIAAGSTKLMGGTNDQAIKAGAESFLPGVLSGVLNHPFNTAENAAKGLKQASTTHINLAKNLDTTTDPVQRKSIIQNMIANKQAQAIAQSPQILDNTPKYNVNKINSNEAYTLSDYAEMLNPNSNYLKDTTNPATITEINKLNMQARNAAQTAGVDIITGSNADKQNRVMDFIDQYENARTPVQPQTNVRQLTPEQVKAQQIRERQAGFAKIPGSDKTKVSQLQDPLSSLKQEALKYKSAEEFVKAQGETVYHRSQNKFDKFDISKVSNDSNRQRNGWGLYFSDAIDAIPEDAYGKNLYEVQAPKGTLIDSQKPVDEKIVSKIVKAVKENNKNPSELNEFSYNGYLFYKTLSRILGGDKNASLFLSKNGIDGLKSRISPTANDYILFNDKSIKTKQQLTDLYNQAHSEAKKNGEITLYHRTSKANADNILKTGKFISKENTGELFLSNKPDGQISGYGDTVIPVRVKKSDLRLDDEFPSGEKHYAIKTDKATLADKIKKNLTGYSSGSAQAGMFDPLDLAGKIKKAITAPVGKTADELNTIQSDLHKKASESFKTASKNPDGTLTEQGKVTVQKAVDEWGKSLDDWKKAVDLETKQQSEELPIVGKPIAQKSSTKVGKPNKQVEVKQPTKVTPQGSQAVSDKVVPPFESIISQNRLLGEGQPLQLTPAQPKVTELTSQSKLSKKVTTSDTIIAEKDKASVIANLEKKHQDFEKLLYGDSTSDIVGGDKGASAYQQKIRQGKETYNVAVEKGLSSENDTIRRLSRGIRTLFGSAGDTAERITKKGEYRGGIDESINIANDFNKLGKTMLPNKASQERVWAVLDPELATTKISESDLKPKELKALQTLRQSSDLINDQNFAMGKISHDAWLKGKDGKYITRAYEEYDIPTELKDTFTQPGKGKLDTGAYKARKDVDQWKQENAIKDPFYLASKRIQSTFRNKAITDYATWINKNTDMISDVPKAGYTQLSESPMWGELSGKNVRKDVLTDIKGFYSDSKALQGAYEMLNAYDKFKPRQILKMTKTVFNPATRLGNQISDRVFATLNGVNVAKFEYNMHKFAPQELANNGKYTRLLRKEGILGTDSTKYDLAKSLIKDGAEPSKINQVIENIKSSYGAVDDKAKLSAFKAWLDSGKTVEEALTKVRNGFQDYSKVGLLYDIGAKTPIVGKPFIRFQSELARIVKNSITENPLRAIGTVGAIALIGEMSSKMSGETAEDKATREGRFGTPVIPFTQIPLVFQTPIGEVNVARMFGMYETAGADTKDKNLIQRASKYLPFDIPTSQEELTKSLGNDILLGGIANQITDRDFRGKSLTDPNINPKYETSTLTDEEKLANRASALYHNYQLPFVNDVENLGRAVIGEKDIYGKTKTPLQAVSKLTGFKVEQFGPEQASEQRAKDAVYSDYDKKDLQSQINTVMKSQAKGEISEETAKARINSLQNKAGATQTDTKSVNGVFKNPSGGYSYLDSDGGLKTEKTESKAKQAVAKMEFEKSDKTFEEKDGIVYTRNDDGTAKAESKVKFEYKLNKATMSQMKEDDNIDGWLTQANYHLKNIYDQLQDKNINPIESMTLQTEADSLLRNMEKYRSYGGFTKGKTSSSASSGAKQLAADESIMQTSSDTLNKLNSLLRGTQEYTKPTIRKAQLKQITVRGEKA